jgi:hypothetical protein
MPIPLLGDARRTLVLAAAVALVAAGCKRPGVGQDVPLDQVLEFDIENPHDSARPAANVTVTLADLATSAGKDFSASCLTLYDGNGEVPYQLDDLDQDGSPDVLAFQVSLQPKQRKRLELFYNSGRAIAIKYPPRAHAAVHPELEGPAWESDAVAFRLLLDGRNAIGVFTKPEPVVAIDRYAKSKEGPRTVQPWGTEACPIGETLGCGGFGFLKDGAVVRPVEAPRTKDQPALRRFAQVVADGPVRAIVRVTIDGWVVDGSPRILRVTHTIWGGRRWATCDLEVGTGWRPSVAIGVAGAKDVPMVRKKEYFYTLGDQSLPMSDTRKPELLGLGILFRQEYFASFLGEVKTADAPDDAGFSRAVVLAPDNDGRVKYAYIAAWGRGKLGLRDAAEFEGLCDSALKDLGAPVLVHLKMRR